MLVQSASEYGIDLIDLTIALSLNISNTEYIYKKIKENSYIGIYMVEWLNGDRECGGKLISMHNSVVQFIFIKIGGEINTDLWHNQWFVRWKSCPCNSCCSFL